MKREHIRTMLAVVAASTSAFQVGDQVEIQTWLNGRSEPYFLADDYSKKNHIVTATLPKGTTGEVEETHAFKPSGGRAEGNTGLHIKVNSGPYAGKTFWVLYRPDKDYVKLLDRHKNETTHVEDAKTVEAKRDIAAIHDSREDIPSQADLAKADQAAFMKWVGELGGKVNATTQMQQASNCDPTNTPQHEALTPVQRPQPSVVRVQAPESPIFARHQGIVLSPAERDYYLRATDLVQSNADPIVRRKNAILSSLPEADRNDPAKVALAIHDWVAQNVDYDVHAYFDEWVPTQTYSEKTDALATLNTIGTYPYSYRGKAVCAGYATLTAALMRAAGLPTRVVLGEQIYKDNINPYAHPAVCGVQAPSHAWDEVLINGDWVPFDLGGDAGGVDFATQTFIHSPTRRELDVNFFNQTHLPCKYDESY